MLSLPVSVVVVRRRLGGVSGHVLALIDFVGGPVPCASVSCTVSLYRPRGSECCTVVCLGSRVCHAYVEMGAQVDRSAVWFWEASPVSQDRFEQGSLSCAKTQYCIIKT